jgi:hypothetical protein
MDLVPLLGFFIELLRSAMGHADPATAGRASEISVGPA